MVLADFGADVVRVDRADVSFNTDTLARCVPRSFAGRQAGGRADPLSDTCVRTPPLAASGRSR